MKKPLPLTITLLVMLGICQIRVLAADPAPERIVIGTWNLEWFFDHDQSDNKSPLAKKLSAPSKADWNWRIRETAKVIAAVNPTIMALQEVENEKVVLDLTEQLRIAHDLEYQVAFIEGRDTYTEQDVALIYQSGLVHKQRLHQTDEMFNSKRYYNLSKHLFATFRWTQDGKTHEITLCNVHLRAGTRGEEPRLRQCRLINYWIQPHLQKNANVIVLGDINTLCQCHDYTLRQDLAVLCGKKTDDQPGDLIDLHTRLKPSERSTHLGGKQFDHILVSPELLLDSPQRPDLAFQNIVRRKDLVLRGEQDKDHYNIFYEIQESERDVSDHYPVVATFEIK